MPGGERTGDDVDEVPKQRRRLSPRSKPPRTASRFRLKLRRVTSFAGMITIFAEHGLDPECAVISGSWCFGNVKDAGCSHEVIKTGSGQSVRTPAFKWVNTALGNIKSAITGTYRSVSSKHVPRYLAEFEYRFNRRYDLAAMIPRLTWASVRTPPILPLSPSAEIG